MTIFAVPAGPAGPGPQGPAGPGPSGPAGPHGPQPSGPPPGSPSNGTGAPWPSRPQGPTGPGGPTAPPKQVDGFLVEIDDLLARIAARQVFLRPPADRIEEAGHGLIDVHLSRLRHAVADLLAYQSPARRDRGDAVAPADGPDRTTQMVLGEEPTPGSGAAFSGAVTRSAGVRSSGAGASIRTGEPPLLGADRGFSLPGRAQFPMFDPVADHDPTDLSHLAVAGKPVRPFPERTPSFEIGTGPIYDALPSS